MSPNAKIVPFRLPLYPLAFCFLYLAANTAHSSFPQIVPSFLFACQTLETGASFLTLTFFGKVPSCITPLLGSRMQMKWKLKLWNGVFVCLSVATSTIAVNYNRSIFSLNVLHTEEQTFVNTEPGLRNPGSETPDSKRFALNHYIMRPLCIFHKYGAPSNALTAQSTCLCSSSSSCCATSGKGYEAGERGEAGGGGESRVLCWVKSQLDFSARFGSNTSNNLFQLTPVQQQHYLYWQYQ